MHEMHKIKLISILNRLTKRRQDAKIDALINYLFGDKTADNTTDITGEIMSPIDTNGEKKSPIIENHENKSRDIDYKACVQSRPQRQRRHRGRCRTCRHRGHLASRCPAAPVT